MPLPPLRCAPILKPRAWGGRSLRQLGKLVPPAPAAPGGESWEIADLAAPVVDGISHVASGPFAGQGLSQLIATHGTALLGRARALSGHFPLLIKYLDAAENLSVQVHPTAEYARTHPGAHLKTEAWFVISATPGASIYRGVRPTVTPAEFRAALALDDAVVAEIHARYGRLDILVNNAGVGYAGPVTEMSLELWRRQMAINVDGVFLGVKHALPLMRDHGGGGSIINVSSIAGIKASANVSGYNASKGAVRLFTKSIALECAAAKDGIRVNSVHPGIVETAIWDTLLGTTEDGSNGRPRTATLDAAVAGAIPLGHKGEAEDIAQGILWLASDESRYVTGTELVIDGGRSIG